MKNKYRKKGLPMLVCLLILGSVAYSQEGDGKGKSSKDVLSTVLEIDSAGAEKPTKGNADNGLFQKHALGVGVGFPQFLVFNTPPRSAQSLRPGLGLGCLQ